MDEYWFKLNGTGDVLSGVERSTAPFTAEHCGDESWAEPEPMLEISQADFEELISLRAQKAQFAERAEFWKQIANSREDCFTRMARAEIQSDAYANDYEETFAELEDAEKQILALEASRDEWMGQAADHGHEISKWVNKAALTMHTRDRAIKHRNMALFAAAVAGGWTIGWHALALMGAM